MASGILSLALRAPDRMSGLGVDGSGIIAASSAAAMSDTTADCKFQKAAVPRHVGTQGSVALPFAEPSGQSFGSPVGTLKQCFRRAALDALEMSATQGNC